MQPTDGTRVVRLNAFFYSFTIPIDTFLTYSVPASVCILKTHRAWYVVEPSVGARAAPIPPPDEPPGAPLRKRDRCACLPSYSELQASVVERSSRCDRVS